MSSKTVEKWFVGKDWEGSWDYVPANFRFGPKQVKLVREDTANYRKASVFMSYRTVLPPWQQKRLFDSELECLQFIHERIVAEFESAKRAFEDACKVRADFEEKYGSPPS